MNAVHCILAGLVASAASGAARGADFAFVPAGPERGFDFVHHDGAAVPPLFPGQNARFGCGPAIADYDGDGDWDVYMPDGFGSPNRLYRNDGAGAFTEVGAAAGVADLGWSHMGLFVDLDNDGDPDLLVVNDCSVQSEHPCSRIYRNEGDGTFTDVTDSAAFRPLDATMGGATAGDYDGDGDLDLFLTGWYENGTWLYRNDGDFTFTDVTDAAGARPAGDLFQWTPVFIDVDDDGDLDIFCAVDFGPDYLLRNQGDGTFVEDGKAGVEHVANDMGVAVGDVNGDGAPDLFCTNITGDGKCSDPHGCDVLYVNDGHGAFTPETAIWGLGDSRWGWGTAFADFDLDGRRELYAVNGWQQAQWLTPAVLYRRAGPGAFTESAAGTGLDHVGNSRGMVPFDADGDGDLDVIIADVLGPAVYLLNDGPPSNHWLAVRPRGRATNRDGVGARVALTADGRTRTAWITAGGSFYASPPLESRFGLGAAARIDRLEVVFPGGGRVIRTNVPIDRVLVVQEPANCGDLDGNARTDFADLLRLLAAWGGDGADPADLDGDGTVGPADLERLLAAWGACSE